MPITPRSGVRAQPQAGSPFAAPKAAAQVVVKEEPLEEHAACGPGAQADPAVQVLPAIEIKGSNSPRAAPGPVGAAPAPRPSICGSSCSSKRERSGYKSTSGGGCRPAESAMASVVGPRNNNGGFGSRKPGLSLASAVGRPMPALPPPMAPPPPVQPLVQPCLAPIRTPLAMAMPPPFPGALPGQAVGEWVVVEGAAGPMLAAGVAVVSGSTQQPHLYQPQIHMDSGLQLEGRDVRYDPDDEPEPPLCVAAPWAPGPGAPAGAVPVPAVPATAGPGAAVAVAAAVPAVPLHPVQQQPQQLQHQALILDSSASSDTYNPQVLVALVPAGPGQGLIPAVPAGVPPGSLPGAVPGSEGAPMPFVPPHPVRAMPMAQQRLLCKPKKPAAQLQPLQAAVPVAAPTPAGVPLPLARHMQPAQEVLVQASPRAGAGVVMQQQQQQAQPAQPRGAAGDVVCQVVTGGNESLPSQQHQQQHEAKEGWQVMAVQEMDMAMQQASEQMQASLELQWRQQQQASQQQVSQQQQQLAMQRHASLQQPTASQQQALHPQQQQQAAPQQQASQQQASQQASYQQQVQQQVVQQPQGLEPGSPTGKRLRRKDDMQVKTQQVRDYNKRVETQARALADAQVRLALLLSAVHCLHALWPPACMVCCCLDYRVITEG